MGSSSSNSYIVSYFVVSVGCPTKICLTAKLLKSIHKQRLRELCDESCRHSTEDKSSLWMNARTKIIMLHACMCVCIFLRAGRICSTPKLYFRRNFFICRRLDPRGFVRRPHAENPTNKKQTNFEICLNCIINIIHICTNTTYIHTLYACFLPAETRWQAVTSAFCTGSMKRVSQQLGLLLGWWEGWW